MPNLPDPVGLNHCRVTGKFAAFVADELDAGYAPDWLAMQGSVEITPNIPYGKNYALGEKATFFGKPITCTIDADGDLSRNGVKYVDLLASGPSISPVNFNYRVKFTLNLPGEEAPTSYGPFDFDVEPGGTVDLTDATPVPGTGGDPITKGEQGFPGDAALTYANDAYGTINLSEGLFPGTFEWRLTGNLTLGIPALSPLISGTLTLILTQDATGGRVVTWPAGIKWPEGIAQQPATGPNTISVIHLFWTGQQWLGIVGGKAFA